MIMNWAAIMWLALLVIFLLTEAVTVNLVSIWFAAGALAAMLVSLLGGQIWLQVVLFFLVSGVLLALLRPLVQKYVNPKIIRTNVYSVVGTTGLVTEDIENISAKGQVKLGAMYWTARSTSGIPIPKDTMVRADRIEGVKVFVSPVR